MSELSISSCGGGAKTLLTNLLPFPADLSNAGWATTGAPTRSSSQITWTTSSDRITDTWFTVPTGNRFILVLRSKANALIDTADFYFARTSMRYFRQGATWVNEARSDLTAVPTAIWTPRFRSDGIYRNYTAQFLAETSDANIMADFGAYNAANVGAIIDYENSGLYDIQGLTGIVYDPNYPSVKFNLDKRIAWWGDSTGISMVYYLSDWLNVIHTFDEAIGGETSPEILARFEAEPEKHVHPTIIWAGHNSVVDDDASGTQIKSDITAMTDALDALGTDYRVLTLIANKTWTNPSSSYTTLTAVNSWINSTYGTKAIDIYAHLRTFIRDANDQTDVDNGIIPRSLQADTIHLNSLGQDHMLDKVFDSINNRGWNG